MLLLCMQLWRDYFSVLVSDYYLHIGKPWVYIVNLVHYYITLYLLVLVVAELFKIFLDNQSQDYLESTNDERKVIDFIAGMTDDLFTSEIQKNLQK